MVGDEPGQPRNFDEMFDADGRTRPAYADYCRWYDQQEGGWLNRKNAEADDSFRRTGITFNVYGEDEAEERLIPFDMVPRIITASEWRRLTRGIEQRVRALNSFLYDLYHRQEIIRAGRVPERLFRGNEAWLPHMVGFTPPGGIYTHIVGIDLVRTGPDEFFVLEDNARTPSGVSYMLENREITKRVLPELFHDHSVQPVDDYPSRLYQTLATLSPRDRKRPCIVVLTPGIYNSAYFEHSFLAERMGAVLVEGNDLFVGDDDCVHMRTVDGPRRVDVVYRRIDDTFIDPEAFRPDSVLGVPGIVRAWKAGNVAIANAPGSGVADDKVIYAFVEKMIHYYLNEKPLIRSVKTYLCMDERDREYVLENLASLVVKPANESGGYGMMVGPHASKATHRRFAKLIEANPRNYIAQPTLSLSTAPTYCDGDIVPRHLDLRPFILQGRESWVTPGGLTRVAMQEGSLVVNSSQGGGSKDTWIVGSKS
ncbi:MAG: circularly permuted type 2 ATP-grasp protein [Erythrobacter sp.]|nr:circularly permuted type 2 ATP-grasp protein [Erythrobacter sp.]